MSSIIMAEAFRFVPTVKNTCGLVYARNKLVAIHAKTTSRKDMETILTPNAHNQRDDESTILWKHIAAVVTQANAIEFTINDHLAFLHLWRDGNTATEPEYLEYVRDHLLKRPLKRKGVRLLQEATVRSALEKSGINPEMARKVFCKWCDIRNRFAHGMLVDDSNKRPVIYHNGICFSIADSAYDFFLLNASMIEIMEAIGSLRSPFHGKPVLRDENNTPDNPFGSEGVIFDLRSKTPESCETQSRT